MKTITTSACLLLFISFSGIGQEVNKEQTPDKTSTNPSTELSNIGRTCLAKLKNAFEPSEYDHCVRTKQEEAKQANNKLERIEVLGRYVGIEVPEIAGRFYLGQDFIESAPRTGGDINDLIALLPGVQVSKDANSLDNLAEISAQQISISGSKPWQTGFFLDGLNYNNRVNPGGSLRTSDDRNNVQGGVQTMNVNSDIVESIEVFDNNIPAEYGDFSGGVVKANTKSAFEQGKSTFKFDYRGNDSSWVDYHTIYGQDVSKDKEADELKDVEPEYKKTNLRLTASHQFNDRHGVLVSVSYLDSVISDLSLGETKNSVRRNINTLAKYSYRRGWVDKLDLSLMNAPYRSETYLKDVKDSDYTLDGGSRSFAGRVVHDWEIATWSADLTISQSENQRTAPAHYFLWTQAKGRQWGAYASPSENINELDDKSVSKQGGYGNLDIEQNRIRLKNQLRFNSFEWLGHDHKVSAGLDLQQQKINRVRAQDHYLFDSGVVYTTTSSGQGLNCAGQSLDCIEQSFFKPIEELEQDLGGQIDFTNLDHLFAYADNIKATAQYFNYRNVIPAETIEVTSKDVGLYVTDSLHIDDLTLNLGLRFDRDDFFNNNNIAYRISAGYDMFSDGSSLLIAGANRYYSAGTVNYKLREQQQPSYEEYRAVIGGYVQPWQPLSTSIRRGVRYQDLKTPYDNEWVIGIKQSLGDFGNISLKYVRRHKFDQLTQSNETLIENGVHYALMANNGTGNSRRLSLSWDGRISDHSFWLNTSYSKSFSDVNNYQIDATNIAVDDLVIYQGEIVSKQELEILAGNFSKPVVVNFGWSYKPTSSFRISATGTHSQAYTTPTFINTLKEGVTISCADCDVTISNSIDVYEDVKKREKTLISLSFDWDVQINDQHSIGIRADISNLFNARTYLIDERVGKSGIEPGRQFWLGVSYAFN